MNHAVRSPETLPDLVRARARQHPQAPVAFHPRGDLSYGDLDRAASSVAHGLLDLGVRPGDRVGVLFANQPEWLAATLGGLYVGALVVPINTWYKEVELAWTLRHCGISVLLCTDALNKTSFAELLTRVVPELATHRRDRWSSSRLPDLRAVVMTGAAPPGAIPWDTFVRSAPSSEDRLRAVAPSGRDGAFVLYTSGSTAHPKGVVLNHGPLVANGAAIGARRLIEGSDRIWLGAPLFYGLGATNALPVALGHGASLVLQDSFDAGRALADIRRLRPSVYYGTGNMTQALLEHPDFSRAGVASLERGTAGLSRHYRRMAIVDLGVEGATPAYGLTETYGHVTGGHPDDPLEVKLGTDGALLPGHELVIRDPQTAEEITDGRVGAIFLRGKVFAGYLDDPGETAKTVDADGWFDTGDLGRLDDRGNLVFEARVKDVIKSGGISISPGEVEGIIALHPDVADVIVLGAPNERKGQIVVAVVVSTADPTEQEIRQFVRGRAASFKAPERVLVRSPDQVPRLASGKVAKQTLLAQVQRELG